MNIIDMKWDERSHYQRVLLTVDSGDWPVKRYTRVKLPNFVPEVTCYWGEDDLGFVDAYVHTPWHTTGACGGNIILRDGTAVNTAGSWDNGTQIFEVAGYPKCWPVHVKTPQYKIAFGCTMVVRNLEEHARRFKLYLYADWNKGGK